MHTAECTCPETTQAPSPQQVWERSSFSSSFFFTFFILLQLVQQAHILEPLQAKETNFSMKDKAAETQLCFGCVVLGMMPLVKKKGLLCPWKPSWDYLWGKIPTISIDRNKDLRLKRCFVSETKSYYVICHWPREKKPQSCELKSSKSPVLEKGLLSALNI